MFGTKRPRVLSTGSDGGRGAGHRHERSVSAASIPRRDPRRQRCPVRVLVRSCRRSMPERRPPTMSSSCRPNVRRTLDRPTPRCRFRRGVHDERERPSSTQRARSSTRSISSGTFPRSIASSTPRASTSSCRRLTTTDHDKVLAFFDDSQRLFYVIPMGRRSVIGTTDTRVDTPFTEATDDDVEFLLDQINARMNLARATDACTMSSPSAPGSGHSWSNSAAATRPRSTGPS